MDAYRAIVDKRDQRAFLPTPLADETLRRNGLHVNRVIGFGYVDPARAAAPKTVARPRLPLEALVRWERWGGA